MANELTDRIKKLIDELIVKRSTLLMKYVLLLELYAKTEAGPQPQGLDAAEMSGLLADIDRHISNLMLELKGIEAKKKG